MMYHYAESGVYLHLRRRLEREVNSFGKLIAKKRNKLLKENSPTHESREHGNAKHYQIGIDNALRTLTILFLGISLACVIFLIEVFHHKITMSKVIAIPRVIVRHDSSSKINGRQ